MVDKLAAADTAIRTNRAGALSAMNPGSQGAGFLAPRLEAGAVAAVQDLLRERPTVDDLFEHYDLLPSRVSRLPLGILSNACVVLIAGRCPHLTVPPGAVNSGPHVI